jgi:hypothetical protein
MLPIITGLRPVTAVAVRGYERVIQKLVQAVRYAQSTDLLALTQRRSGLRTTHELDSGYGVD